MSDTKKNDLPAREFEAPPKPITMSESIRKLTSLYGANFDKFKPTQRTSKLRALYKTETGTIYETDHTNKDGNKTIKE